MPSPAQTKDVGRVSASTIERYDVGRVMRLTRARRSTGPSACSANPDSEPCRTSAAMPRGSPSGHTSRSPTAGSDASPLNEPTDVAVRPRVFSRAFHQGENGATASTTWLRTAASRSLASFFGVRRSQAAMVGESRDGRDNVRDMAPWSVNDIPDQAGRTALVTGANSGLGLHTSLALARRGARVLMACRNPAKADEALSRVTTDVPGCQVELVAMDLASLASIRSAAEDVAGRTSSLDLLVDNAG